MIPYIFDTLLVLMLALLYWTGKQLQNNNVKILSVVGAVAILAFTLNEGLRFGRGIDYNIYWINYMYYAQGWDTNQNIGFVIIQKVFLFFNLPFQALIMFMSFMFILGTLFLMKYYKAVIVFALPLWVFFSMATVENLLRWYLAFSFIMIGLSCLMSEKNRPRLRFILFCLIGCSIHYAILPIPVILYFLYYRKKPLVNPVWTIIAFVLISIFFETSYMLSFVDLVNYLSTLSDKFSGYGENAEFWLTNNALGTDSNDIGFVNTIFGFFLVLVGYKCSMRSGQQYVFAYNMFLIGFVFRSIAMRVELVGRFDQIFFFFRAIVFANIIKLIILKKVEYRSIVMMLAGVLLTFYIFSVLTKPFKANEMRLLYVWDSRGKTPDSMLNMYLMDKYKKNSQFETKEERKKQLK